LIVLFFIKEHLFIFSIFAFAGRRQYEKELKKLEEKTARRIEEAIQKNIEEKFDLEEVILEIERRIAEGVKKLFDDVEVQLEKEKQDALNKTRRKELSRLTRTFLFSFTRLSLL
ncbi:hypothetical protein HN51_069624, partial [Arachis hypogaea]